jgi:hypothetical protein
MARIGFAGFELVALGLTHKLGSVGNGIVAQDLTAVIVDLLSECGSKRKDLLLLSSYNLDGVLLVDETAEAVLQTQFIVLRASFECEDR